MQRGDTPFKKFGTELAKIRTRMQESLAEVSGAVEIDENTLTQYEIGVKRPSEDILDLLLAHFSLKDEEASRLWKLAGYDESKIDSESDDPMLIQQPVIILPIDARVVYTDAMNVVIDNHGVIINFMQGNAQTGQQLPAARVGMSLDYAKKVADTLAKTIETAEKQRVPKQLPSSRTDKKKQN